jgi:hypothetical protein
MEYAKFLELEFEDGINALWRTVKAMPGDKLDWHPAKDARSAREILGEVVGVMPYSIAFVRDQKMPEMNMDGTKYPSLEAMEKRHRELVAEFIAEVKKFPEDKLSTVNELPWGKMTFLDVITYPYWNMMYHYGQIGFIQTMYGDKETH